jgi:hypothetical protein
MRAKLPPSAVPISIARLGTQLRKDALHGGALAEGHLAVTLAREGQRRVL